MHRTHTGAFSQGEPSSRLRSTRSRAETAVEVQSTMRTLRDAGKHSTTAANILQRSSTGQHRQRTAERASTSLRKRMPFCRYQSLPEFKEHEPTLAELAEGANPPPHSPPMFGSSMRESAKSSTTRDSSSMAASASRSFFRSMHQRSSPSLGTQTDSNWLMASMNEDNFLTSSMQASSSSSSRNRLSTQGAAALRMFDGAQAARQTFTGSMPTLRALPENGSLSPVRTDVEVGGSSMRARTHYEMVCAQEAMLPKFARTVQTACSGSMLDLTGSGLGDRQLTALLKDAALMPLDKLRCWKLRDARLGDPSAAAIASVVRDDVELIDLACNNLTSKGVSTLATLMSSSPLYRLRKLDLSGNAVGDEALGPLCEGLPMCTALLRLDMHSNSLRDGVKLGHVLAGHSQLMRLGLRRNYLAGDGTAGLFDGILKNSKAGYQLADVDIAWNSIGSSSALHAAQAIAAVLRESAALYHCDLSYNGMDPASCAILADGLRDNHSLYGLHVVGNAVTMDADGFLTPLDGNSVAQQFQQGHLERFGDLMTQPHALVGASKASATPKRLSVELDRVGTADGASPQLALRCNGQWSIEDDLRGRDASERQTACWACEGWERVELEWPVDPKKPEPKAVWAFTNLDAFRKGLRLQKTGNPPRFVAARMVPPGWRLNVVFQVDAAIRIPPDCTVDTLNPSVDIKLRACEELQVLQPPPDNIAMLVEWDGPIPTIKVDKAGVVSRNPRVPHLSMVSDYSRRRSVAIDSRSGGPAMTMLRVTEAEFKIKTKVQRGRAFYADFRREDPELTQQCFQLDWSRCRVGRLAPEAAMVGLEGILEANYGLLIAIYRRYSALDIVGDTELGISQLQASELVVSAGLGGDAVTKISDIDRFFIAAKVTSLDQKKEMVVVNDKSLVRYEFLEFLVRIAHQRFFMRGVVDTMRGAVGLLLDALAPFCKREASLMEEFFSWLHTEEVDDVFKKHNEKLDLVYKNHSGSRTLPGRTKTMVLIEFQRLLDQMDVYDNEFQSRLTGVAFRMGMMTQRDESGSSRFQEMTFVEFQHALAAVVFLKEGFSGKLFPHLLDTLFTESLQPILRELRRNNATKRAATKDPKS